MAVPLPSDEKERLAALYSFGILDTGEDPRFERVVQLASVVLDVPMSLVSLVDRDRQWFKAKIGLSSSETPRDVAFCAHTIVQDDVLIVEDATKDSRFAENPLVTGVPNIRFYAGAPLVVQSGHKLGTLCVIDKKPRTLSAKQLQVLKTLAAVVADCIAIHKEQIEAKEFFAHAESQTKERSIFFASINHELRTPLNHIIGFANMIESEAFGNIGSSKYKEYAKIIEDSGTHLLEIVESAILLGKVAYSDKVHRNIILINPIIESLSKTFETSLSQKKNCLIIEPSESLIQVYADSLSLRQVIINLVTNAINHTPPGTRILIGVSFDETNKNASIAVTDDGPGLPDKVLQSLGTAFMRGGSNSDENKKGVGLGLRISKQLVEAMDGRLTFEAPSIGGTRAIVELPLYSANNL